MKKALLFRENGEPVLVSAEDIKNGLYGRDEEFVDPEYEYEVRYVKGAKNNGGPYFRFYHSLADYKKLHPDRATKYEIVRKMRHYQECKWHREWEDKVSAFCEIEKYFKNPSTHKRRRADAFHTETGTVVEFQHSFIAGDFEERNRFYAELGYRVIWLYDLPTANARLNEDGNVEILENNARGFFRISEFPGNLENNYVYIQVKSEKIYRVKHLFRHESSTDKQSTIRFFELAEEYTEEEFIQAIKKDQIIQPQKEKKAKEPKGKPLSELWQSHYRWMGVFNTQDKAIIYINRDHNGNMFRDFENGCIKYSYELKAGAKQYWLSHKKEKQPIWVLAESSN